MTHPLDGTVGASDPGSAVGNDAVVNKANSNADDLWSSRDLSSVDQGSLHNSHRTEDTADSHISRGMGSIPLQPGEFMVEPFQRPLSAPPPPGFNAPGLDERTRQASGLIMRPTGGSGKHQGGEDDRKRRDNDRSSSFTDLAAVLGAGLAQSMDDATHEIHLLDSMFSQGKDLNFHRQSRHTASRLLGISGELLALQKANQTNDETTGAGAADGAAFAFSHGFPTSLSSPQKKRSDHPQSATERAEEKREAPRGSTTPVQMVPGLALPSMDIGTNVSEPEGENQLGKQVSRVISQRIDVPPTQRSEHAGVVKLERGLQSLMSSEAREFRPALAAYADLASNNSSISDSNNDTSEITSRRAEVELQPFLWDVHTHPPSRTLAILHVSYLRVPDVRSSCETYGVLESFRADFSSRGIYFVSYYDIRSAQYAAAELQSILQRLSVMQRSSEEVVVEYCLPLNSSSQFDDSQILLSELPVEINEYNLRSILSSYGSIRSVEHKNIGSFAVEFHSIQDAKQAQLELESSQPFGTHAFVETGMRNSVDRKRGRELLAMISRWRQGMSRQMTGQPLNSDPRFFSAGAPISADPWQGNQQPLTSSLMSAPNEVVGLGSAYSHAGGRSHHSFLETTQLVLGPDGRYTPVVVQNHHLPVSAFPPQGATPIDPHHQQLIRGPDGQMYLASVSATQLGGHMYSNQLPPPRQSHAGFPITILTQNVSADDVRRAPQTRTPYYTHVVTDASSLSGRSHRSAYTTGSEGDKDTRHLLLDLDAVELGGDIRTSLMVRNIPNKYTQQMLLSEFEENGHGPGVIDFFYLPIDFKNRCNRGYAFINFVDYRDILAFHQRYFGKHWRTFNSDKICDITYARIQGKAAMLKRFENSALMEKDDEYKPLVFVSSGPEKGKRLPFPDPSSKNHVHI